MFTDSHCHFLSNQFKADRDAAYARAVEAGVTTMLSIGLWEGPGTVEANLEFARSHAGVYASVGVHPHEAKLPKPPDLANMAKLADLPEIIGWGEIGLDYWYEHSPRDVQREMFVLQMEMAQEARLPIIIHCRGSQPNANDAWDETLVLLREHWSQTGLGGILHCFSGEVHHAQAALDLGFMISFSGNVTFPKAQNIRDAAVHTPIDRILIETDSPYLAPVPHRGRRNEPAFVKEVALQIGDLKKMLRDDVGEKTSDNFKRFFKLEN